MTQVKGSNICFAKTYMEEQDGPDAWGKVLERLSAEDRDTVQAAISMGWYDLSLQHRVFVALDDALSSAGKGGIEAFAEAVVKRDLTVVHRTFLRLATPLYVLEKSGEYWSRFYDAGKWSATRNEATGIVRGELTGIDEPHPIFCRFLTSYIVCLFRLVGSDDAKCSHPRCVCRGAPACVFEGTGKMM